MLNSNKYSANQYLNKVDNVKHRKIISTLIMASHQKLSGTMTNEKDEKCVLCGDGSVENIYHIVLHCKQFCKNRNNLFTDCNVPEHIDDDYKLMFLLSFNSSNRPYYGKIIHFITGLCKMYGITC